MVCQTYLAILVACAMMHGAFGNVHTNCTFPDIMNLKQDEAVDHTWRFLAPDPTYNRPHSTGQWSFHMHSVYISHGHSLDDYDSADGYDYDCIEKVGPNKVLVKRIDIEDGDREQFTCLEFVPRSSAVVQLKMADYAETADASLCSEANLKNNDTTLVHFHSAMWYKVIEKIPYMTCGLDGGYVIEEWFDQDGETGCTADVKNSLRIEDECDRGSGLQFSGDTKNCPSPIEDLDLYKDPLTCIANWKDKKYVYSVATDEWNSFFVCLRIPKDKGNLFDMHIFLDGTCDSTETITHSKKYRKLTMNKYIVSDLCADASPRCSLLSKDDCVGNVPNMCRKSCGVCPEEKAWKESELPKDIQGDWYMQTSEDPGNKVVISERAIRYPGRDPWIYFGESTCERNRVGHQKKATEYMFSSASVNGCLPRVATVMVNTFSKSVLGVQISQSAASQLGLVNNTSAWTNDMKSMCDSTQYSQDNQRLRDKYHTAAYGWQNLVQIKQHPILSKCNIKEEQDLSVTLNSGATCKGHLKMGTHGNSFDMVLDDCGKDNDTVNVPGGLKEKVRYECMAQFKGAHEWDSYIITRTPGATRNVVNETYVCWYLPEDKGGFLMPVSSCDDMTEAEVSLDEKQPLARLHLVKDDQDSNSVTKVQYQIFSSVFSILLAFLYN